MERVIGEATSASTQDAASGTEAQYQPPAVAWEEEFQPVADSVCDPENEFCGDFRPPWEKE
jgi:hypothetical protein